MKDPHDLCTPDLFGSTPTPAPEFEGIAHTDQQAREFWRDYIAELKINGYSADDALEMLWRQYDELPATV